MKPRTLPVIQGLRLSNFIKSSSIVFVWYGHRLTKFLKIGFSVFVFCLITPYKFTPLQLYHIIDLKKNYLKLFFLGAIAAGNCVIIKLPDGAPTTCRTIASLLPKYLDPVCYPIYQGGVAETTELLKERFDYIFFTGSTRVGKIIYQAAAKYLTPVTLELGGKSPVFIDSTADIKMTAKRIWWGKIINSGQTCIAPDYILCTKEVQEQFIKHSESIFEEFFSGKKLFLTSFSA